MSVGVDLRLFLLVDVVVVASCGGALCLFA